MLVKSINFKYGQYPQTSAKLLISLFFSEPFSNRRAASTVPSRVHESYLRTCGSRYRKPYASGTEPKSAGRCTGAMMNGVVLGLSCSKLSRRRRGLLDAMLVESIAQ